MRSGLSLPCAQFLHTSRHVKNDELRLETIDLLFRESTYKIKPKSTLSVLNDISESVTTPEQREIVFSRYDSLVKVGMDVTETPIRLALLNRCEESVNFPFEGVLAYFVPLPPA